MKSARAIRAALAVAVLGLSLPARAQHDPMSDRFTLNLGGFFQTFDTSISFYKADGSQTPEINMQDVLGTPDRQTNFRAEGYWRFGPHGSAQFGYRSWNIKNSRTIDQNIQVGDKTYNAGAYVESQLRASVADLYYGYSFVHSPYLELGAGIGLSAYFSKVALSGTGTITGPDGTKSVSYDENSSNLIAPIPALTLFAQYSLLESLSVFARAKGITATIGGYHGEMFDFVAGAEFFFTKNVGIGASYEYVNIKYSHQETRGVSFKYKYSGPLAYLALKF